MCMALFVCMLVYVCMIVMPGCGAAEHMPSIKCRLRQLLQSTPLHLKRLVSDGLYRLVAMMQEEFDARKDAHQARRR